MSAGTCQKGHEVFIIFCQLVTSHSGIVSYIGTGTFNDYFLSLDAIFNFTVLIIQKEAKLYRSAGYSDACLC